MQLYRQVKSLPSFSDIQHPPIIDKHNKLMGAVRAAVHQAGIFFVCGEIDLWKDFVGPTYTSFVSAHRKLMLQRRREYEVHCIECNKTNRLAGSVRSGSSKSACGTSTGKDAAVTAGSKKNKPKGETIVKKKKGGASTSKKPAKPKNVVGPDPDIFHKLKKPSRR